MNTVLLIDKPAGWTSFDVVAKVRSELRKQLSVNNQQAKKIKVGHAGTLDPFATGLLIVLIGDETKNQDSYMKQDKEYVATLKLGFVSTTGDPEGEIKEIAASVQGQALNSPDRREGRPGLVPPRNDVVENVLKQFLGEISQIPPIYSAIKVDGKRAYKLARAGETPEMKPRLITIHELNIENYEYPNLKINVKCSSGTYIRTLGEDIGKALNTGAYLTALRRTKIGEYDVRDALTVDETLSTLSSLA